MFTNEKIKLTDIKIEDGYTLTNAIYSAMSSDYTYWQLLLKSQAKSKENLSNTKLIRELNKTIFFIQDVTSPNTQISKQTVKFMNARTWVYSGDSSCFHAKLAILRYEKKQENKNDKSIAYLIAVMSKNMVYRDYDDQNIIWQWAKVKREKCEVNTSTNGKKLWKYIEYCANNCQKDIYGLKKINADVSEFADIQYVETDNFDIFFNGIGEGKLSKELFQNNEIISVCKSYFVGEEYRKRASKNSDLIVYTKYNQSDKSDETHMKLYFVKKDNEILFYSGSANLSENALCGDNVECLVRSRINQSDLTVIINNLQKHGYRTMREDWPWLIQPGDERKEENEVIKTILKEKWIWKKTNLSSKCYYIANESGEKVTLAEHNDDWMYEIMPISAFENYGKSEDCMVEKPEEAVLVLRKKPDYSVCRIKVFRPSIECGDVETIDYDDFDFDKEYEKACCEEVNKAKRIISECYKIRQESEYSKVIEKIHRLDMEALDVSVRHSIERIEQQLHDEWRKENDRKK